MSIRIYIYLIIVQKNSVFFLLLPKKSDQKLYIKGTGCAFFRALECYEL